MFDVFGEFIHEYPGIFVLSVQVFIASVWAMQHLTGIFTIRQFTIPAVFYLTYLLMIFFPSFWVYLDRPGPFRDSFIIGVVSVLVTVPLGIFFANMVFGFSKKEVTVYFKAPVDETDDDMYTIHLILAVIAVGSAVIYFIRVPSIPLIQMISNPGEVLALTLAREESFKLLDPRWGGEASTNMFYLFLFLRTLLFPVIILSTMGYYLYTRKRKWLVLFLPTLLVGCFYAASSLSRAPISAIFMRVFFFLHLFNRGHVSRKTMIFFVGLMLTFPLLVTVFAYSTDISVWDGLGAIGTRLTYTPALDLYYYFEIFPSNHEYLYGHTLVKPFLKLFGAEYFYIENYVHLYISPNGIESGHANAAFISNFHADFGLFGVLMGGIFTGAFMQMLQIYLSRQRKTVLNIGVYSFIIYAIWALNFGSITSVLFVNGVIPVLILVWMIRFSSRIVKTFSLQTRQKIYVMPLR
ncbi:MAG: oligosaccharide repeat unit polymerase [Candidatus Manganitrophus sp. SA1]|nr:oligosaccharide repeat unit polymerase [Candidatus Manganitrophus morganii]